MVKNKNLFLPHKIYKFSGKVFFFLLLGLKKKKYWTLFVGWKCFLIYLASSDKYISY